MVHRTEVGADDVWKTAKKGKVRSEGAEKGEIPRAVEEGAAVEEAEKLEGRAGPGQRSVYWCEYFMNHSAPKHLGLKNPI